MAIEFKALEQVVKITINMLDCKIAFKMKNYRAYI